MPPPGDLLDPGIEPGYLMSSSLASRFFTTRATWAIETLRMQHPSAGKESVCSTGDAGDTALIPGLEDPLEEGMETHSSILA